MVGAPRFELGAFGTQNRRATRLRYAPRPLPVSQCEPRYKTDRTVIESIGATQAFRGFRKRGMDHLGACGNA